MAVDPRDEFSHSNGDFQSREGHVPVLLAEVLEYLRPHSGGRYIDATFGGGGHSRVLLERSAPDGRLLAIDADPEALVRARLLTEEFSGRFQITAGNFRDLASIADTNEFTAVDGILMDLGLSSFQLDQAVRGFSFQHPGPLDMRFDPHRGPSAEEIVNEWPEEDLARIVYEYGEEQRSRAIARAIVRERGDERIRTTDRLATIVERAVGGRRGRAIHPATKTFQALRIAVNDELESLRRGLDGALDLLAEGGRLAVISFHSLEDRIVKTFMRQESTDCICPPETPVCVCGHRARLRIITRKVVQASEQEQRMNPRSRSAKLRVAERLP